ncbi:MAG: ascorbate system component [Clostridia bacterium]|jgi:PTS system ascorbate-specific IIB component|nr:ascorbate system component [Clostridia bacterium]
MSDRELSILTVCGVGVGSSLMLKANVRELLDKYKISAKITNTDMTTARANEADIVITTPDIYKSIKGIKTKKIVLLNNMVSMKELEEKLIPACKELLEK